VLGAWAKMHAGHSQRSEAVDSRHDDARWKDPVVRMRSRDHQMLDSDSKADEYWA
jgi:hypothetical protein